MNDLRLSEQQSELRAANQSASAKSKSKGKPSAQNAHIKKGSLVYIKADGSKTACRDRYIVVNVDDEYCVVQKFVKSQLRSKRYQLKLTEIYPVVADPIIIPGNIRGCDDTVDDSEDVMSVLSHQSEADSLQNPPRDCGYEVGDTDSSLSADGLIGPQGDSSNTCNFESSIPDRVEDCSALQVYQEVDTVQNNSGTDTLTAEAYVEAPRRSSRQSSKPKWMEKYVVH